MLREKLVFGPIFSRRLGSSLGINLLPENGKLCNFDCVYCECGWNRDGREDTRLPQPAELRSELERVLADCLEKGVRIDSITFSGDGEPTLNPHFPEMIDITLELRDKYFPDSVVSVLSNATLISRPGVREALMRVDNPILKLDAGIDSLALKMNQPSGHYSVRETVEAMKSFNGNFVLQTMFLKGPGINSLAADNLEAWRNIVRELRPREVMMYTLDRPAPAEGLEKVPVESMEEAATPLIQEGFKVQIKG
ncbi:MAG: radical SAM protein [Candidatus Cryptobacteroides sp.]|nr:radical SAM protein [Candidatus Cryptobacteroides sp.]